LGLRPRIGEAGNPIQEKFHGLLETVLRAPAAIVAVSATVCRSRRHADGGGLDANVDDDLHNGSSV
jgi:hypothetical protein